jgi:hypothetical protein
MIRLEAATVMLQWAVGGLGFLWFTTRRGQVGPGYGMLLRITYAVFAVIAVVLGFRYGVVAVREASGIAVAIAALVLVRNTNPRLDLIAPLLGIPGIVAAGLAASTDLSFADSMVSLARVLVGTAFLGCGERCDAARALVSGAARYAAQVAERNDDCGAVDLAV